MENTKSLQRQVVYLFAILIGVMAAAMFLYSMGERQSKEDPKRSSPAAVSMAPASAPREKVSPTSEGALSGPSLRGPAAPSLIEVLEKYDRQAHWEVSEHPDRRPSHILGGRIKCDEKEIEKCDGQGRALGILRTLAEALEIDSSSLKQTSISVGSNSYQLDQFYQGYRVVGGTIKGFANSANSEIYHVVNELRKIESADLSRTVSEVEARQFFAKKFSIEDAGKIQMVQSGLVLTGDSPTSNRLVWWMQYGQRHPPKSFEAFVNASNGHVTVLKGQ